MNRKIIAVATICSGTGTSGTGPTAVTTTAGAARQPAAGHVPEVCLDEATISGLVRRT